MFESSVEQTGGRWSINSITISKLLVVNLLTPRPDQTECSDLLTAAEEAYQQPIVFMFMFTMLKSIEEYSTHTY